MDVAHHCCICSSNACGPMSFKTLARHGRVHQRHITQIWDRVTSTMQYLRALVDFVHRARSTLVITVLKTMPSIHATLRDCNASPMHLVSRTPSARLKFKMQHSRHCLGKLTTRPMKTTASVTIRLKLEKQEEEQEQQ